MTNNTTPLNGTLANPASVLRRAATASLAHPASALRRAAAASLALALTLCALAAAPPDAAQAEDASIAVETNGPTAALRIYQLFDADIAPNDGTDAQFPAETAAPDAYPGIGARISWSSKVSEEATLSFLDENGFGEWLAGKYPDADDEDIAQQHGRAQNAAEYIAERIGGSDDDPDAATAPVTKAARSFALELVKALDAAFTAGDAAVYRAEADDDGIAEFTGAQGYYLFVSDDAAIGHDEAATAPIWVPLGGSTTRIALKAAIPTLDKQVREDSTGMWGAGADAGNGQDLEYRLVATLPSNIGAYDSYHLKFTDTLPAGLALSGGDARSVRVTIGKSIDITADLVEDAGSIDYSDGVLHVDVADIKTVHAGVSVNAGSTVEVGYRAHLTPDAVIGQPGNENSAQLAYTADPVTGADGTTIPDGHKTRTYTYRLDVNKVDKQTHENLAGARFTVERIDVPDAGHAEGRVEEPAEEPVGDPAEGQAGKRDEGPYASTGRQPGADAARTRSGNAGDSGGTAARRYVQADGSLALEPHEFTTGDDGRFSIPRIDSGSYVLHETAAPEGYELQDADITMRIEARIGETGQLESWDATTSGGEAATSSDTDIATHVVGESTSIETGVVSVQTPDDKKAPMPLTGREGTGVALAVAGGVLLASIAGLHRGRRREDRTRMRAPAGTRGR